MLQSTPWPRCRRSGSLCRGALGFEDAAPDAQEPQRGADAVFEQGLRWHRVAVGGRVPRVLELAARLPEPGHYAAVRIFFGFGPLRRRSALGFGAGTLLGALRLGLCASFCCSGLGLLALFLYEA